MHSRSMAIVCAVTAVVLAAAAPQPPSAVAEFGEWVKQEVDVPLHNPDTSSWARGAHAEGAAPLTLTVALRVDSDRRDELERVFFEVSDPDHLNYGRFLSLDEVTALLKVPKERADAVAAYFAGQGATGVETSPNGDMLTVTMPVAAAEVALNTAIHVFAHAEWPQARVLRAVEHYSLPAKIAQHVSMVGELLQFPRLPPKPVARSNLQGSGKWPNDCDDTSCKGLVTPGVIAKAYKLPSPSSNVTSGVNGNSMAVAEFQGQFYKKSDLSTFGQKCHRDVKVDVTVGEEEPEGGVEAELDIEYIKSVAPEIPLTAIYQNQYSLLSWSNQINSMRDAPLVHSVSYGNDERQQSSTEYMYTCNTAFMKAGARGLSILFASGDQGVCGREGCGWFRKRFKPDFPAASPYITAVGGTNFEGDDIGAETAWNDGGGGFSDTFAVPAYQRDAVAEYLKNPDADLPPQSMWNASGRGYPDVAALGGLKNSYCVYVGGSFQGVAGTSASSPVVAGVFAKLNGLRLAKGKPPLGFLNPFIYKNPSGFQDVKSGVNNAGGKYGFKAVKGWDAATGFGSPNYELLSQLVVSAYPDEPSLVV